MTDDEFDSSMPELSEANFSDDDATPSVADSGKKSSLSASSPADSRMVNYQLLHKLAEGGMGAAYAAQQIFPIQRKVAIKVIKGSANGRQIVARFEAERQALAMMDHPHIAKIFDAGTNENDAPYFVMELVCSKQQ